MSLPINVNGVTIIVINYDTVCKFMVNVGRPSSRVRYEVWWTIERAWIRYQCNQYLNKHARKKTNMEKRVAKKNPSSLWSWWTLSALSAFFSTQSLYFWSNIKQYRPHEPFDITDLLQQKRFYTYYKYRKLQKKL